MNKKNKNALMPLGMMVAMIVLVVLLVVVLYFSKNAFFNLFEGSKTVFGPFDSVCCCKGSDANDCSEIYRKECDESLGFVVMDDMKNCEVK